MLNLTEVCDGLTNEQTQRVIAYVAELVQERINPLESRIVQLKQERREQEQFQRTLMLDNQSLKESLDQANATIVILNARITAANLNEQLRDDLENAANQHEQQDQERMEQDPQK
ncbi:hypothetical protein L596_000944 [Steinernema carpocapsae]|uniref:Uncharacterized protein n=1 Tax=Steinernema carpocapsae TaxID=34508 RepID=A0A4U8UK62_STECR|nr:hypothetical protein L596_000944 [Steinernema carpocapsae]